MKRRILPMFMAVMMILSIIQMPAWAADESSPMETDDSTELTDVGETDSGEGEAEEAAKTLTEIFAEASDGETLTLEQNVTVSGTTDADYKNSGTVTLDLNEHTITGKNGNIALRANAGNGTLKLTNGKIVADQGTYCTVSAANSTLELSDMELENVTAYGCSIKAFYGGTINLHEVNSKSTTGGGVAAAGGTVNVYDSTFTQKGHYDHNSVNLSASNGTGTVNVYSGTFTSENYGLYIFSSGGTINVYDGTFKAGKDVLRVDLDLESYPDAEAYVNISGGTFDGEIQIADKEGIHVQITGGTFTNTGLTEEEFSAYVPESALLTEGTDGTFTVEKLDASNAAAEIGGQYYGTLTKAWSAALSQGTATITLLKDLSGQGVLDLNKAEANITIDLNGHNVGFAYQENIKVHHGGLNIIGRGKLYEETPYFAPVIVYGSEQSTENNYSVVTVGEGVTLEGYYGLQIDHNNNSAYGIVVTVNGTLTGKRDTSSWGGVGLYVNGNINKDTGSVPQITINPTAVLTGEHGEHAEYGISCGMYLAGYAKTIINGGTIEADTGIEIRAGEIIISDGTIIGTATPTEVDPNGNGSTTTGAGIGVAQHTTTLPIKVTINGGTISGFTALFESTPEKESNPDVIELNVTGGTFNAINNGTQAVYSESKTEFISGGTFSSDPSAYVVPDKIALVQNNGMYTIETASKTAAEVVSGEPEVKAAEGIAGEVKNALANTTAAGLTGEANTEANNNTVTTTDGKNALENAGVTVNNNTVTIVVQPYLDIEVTEYSADASAPPNTMTMDITPMVRTVATTANVASNPNAEIILKPESGKTQNAVQIGTAEELTVRGSITLTIPLPNGFAETGKTVYIQHKDIYEYTAKVENGTSLHITFVNPHGFSVFTVSTSSAAVAKVDGTSYISLQAAVDAVKNNGTITLVNDCDDTATVSRPVTFMLDTSIHNFTGSIVAGNGYTLTESGNKYVVTRTPVTPVDPGDDDDHGSSSSSSVRRYDIEADAGRGGDISPDGRVRVRRGENQTFRITADDGWEIADVEVDGESVGAVERYTFENVRTDHTISVTFRQIVTEPEEPETPALPFTDVAEGDWYHDAVAYCWENGIMDGTSGTLFAPNLLLNRAMMAQVLYNLADGTPAAAAGFPDVSPTAWYADAVNWAAANGYVTGYDNGLFGPEDDLTREQMAAILHRYAGSPAPAGTLDGFADAASASAYAVDALRWAVGEGLLTGKDGGRLDPTGTASRAELAQILARFAG